MTTKHIHTDDSDMYAHAHDLARFLTPGHVFDWGGDGVTEIMTVWTDDDGTTQIAIWNYVDGQRVDLTLTADDIRERYEREGARIHGKRFAPMRSGTTGSTSTEVAR